MKKIMTAILCIAFVFSLTVSASAAYTKSAINVDIVNFTDEEIARQKQIDAKLQMEFESRNISRGAVDRITLTAPIVSHQQENTYYCGPASTQMVYEGITGDTTHEQSWFANKLGTTSKGTSSYQIATVLSDLTDKNYSVTNVKTAGQSEMDLYNNIACSLRLKCAVVANIAELPGKYTTSGHFIVIHGSFIDAEYGESTIYYTYTDPHYKSEYYGTFQLSGSSMYKAINSNAGNYIRAT